MGYVTIVRYETGVVSDGTEEGLDLGNKLWAGPADDGGHLFGVWMAAGRVHNVAKQVKMRLTQQEFGLVDGQASLPDTEEHFA